MGGLVVAPRLEDQVVRSSRAWDQARQPEVPLRHDRMGQPPLLLACLPAKQWRSSVSWLLDRQRPSRLPLGTQALPLRAHHMPVALLGLPLLRTAVRRLVLLRQPLRYEGTTERKGRMQQGWLRPRWTLEKRGVQDSPRVRKFRLTKFLRNDHRHFVHASVNIDDLC